MKGQLLVECMLMLAVSVSFVVFVLALSAGIYRHYQDVGSVMDGMYRSDAAYVAQVIGSR